MNRKAPTISLLRKAVETGDTASLKALYADNAVITIIDSVNIPSKPKTLKGAREIGAFIDDVYSRDMTHEIDSGIVDDTMLAFVENCKYSDGTQVIASNTAVLGPNGIIKQTIVQAWDS